MNKNAGKSDFLPGFVVGIVAILFVELWVTAIVVTWGS
jgi:hypothetical protein